MNWRIEEREAFEVFGIERIFDNFESRDVVGFWDECFQNGSYAKLLHDAEGVHKTDGYEYPREDGACVINAMCGYGETGDNSYPYMLYALKKPDVNTSGYTVAQIPKTTWAIFKSGSTDWAGGEFPTLFSQAYSEWLPTSGYDRASGPDMEIYYGDVGGKQFAELWLPVKKK